MVQLDSKEMGKRIAELRGSETQEDLAKKLLITREKLSMWEQGRRQIKDIDLARLGEIFNVSTDYLLFGVEAKQISIHHDLGLTQTAIDTLQQFKNEDYVLGDEKKSAGKCKALSIALSSPELLNVLSSLMNVHQGEPGYFEASIQSDNKDFYYATLSPDSYVTILFHRLQLIIHSLRTGDKTIFTEYAPIGRMGKDFDSDPRNYSMLFRKKKAKRERILELNALHKEIIELKREGAQDGKES